MFSASLLLLLTLGVFSVCAADGIEGQLDGLFDDISFARSFWGVKVVSLDTGRTLYERNAGKLFVPASNMKILTAAGALRFLGEEFVFRTPVSTSGSIENGILKGDLIITGSGDPSLGMRFAGKNPGNPLAGDPWAVFAAWAGRLKEKGIRTIEGNIVGVDSFFSEEELGNGWSWEDMPYSYSAGVGALQFNETTAYVQINPGKEPGSAVSVNLIPRLETMSVVSGLEVVPPECDTNFEVVREGRNFVISGQISAGTGVFFRGVALPSPTLYFLDMLRETLIREGVAVTGQAEEADQILKVGGGNYSRLFVHDSPPLREIVGVMLEVSQNQYAETLFRMLDRKESGKDDDGAVKTLEGILDSMGVPPDSYELADGSGLSRHNLLSPEAIIRVLQYMYRGDGGPDFVEMMPRSGVKGTIKGRMRGTRAEERVSAKTGTLAWVRALSGYLETAGGEMLAFSMLVNNYNQPRRSAEYLQDQALEILVGYGQDQ